MCVTLPSHGIYQHWYVGLAFWLFPLSVSLDINGAQMFRRTRTAPDCCSPRHCCLLGGSDSLAARGAPAASPGASSGRQLRSRQAPTPAPQASLHRSRLVRAVACHGAMRPVAGSRILQTEYSTWVVAGSPRARDRGPGQPGLAAHRAHPGDRRRPARRRSASRATALDVPAAARGAQLRDRGRELRGLPRSGDRLARAAHVTQDATHDAVRSSAGCTTPRIVVKRTEQVPDVPPGHGRQVRRSRDDRRRTSGSRLRSRGLQRGDAAALARADRHRRRMRRFARSRRTARAPAREPRTARAPRQGSGLARVRGARLLRVPSQPHARPRTAGARRRATRTARARASRRCRCRATIAPPRAAA